MKRIALKVLMLVVVSIAALTPAAAEASHNNATYSGKSGNGAVVTVTVNGNTAFFRVENDLCGQSASGQATIDGRHWFGGRFGNLAFGGWFSQSDSYTVQGSYQFMGCPLVNWKAEKRCDCKDTRVFGTWINVHDHYVSELVRDRAGRVVRDPNGKAKRKQVDIQYVQLHLVVECEVGTGTYCSGWAEASVSGATAVPAKIRLSCVSKDKCPDRMEATKDIKIRRYVEKGAGKVRIKIRHACTGGTEKTTTLTIQYDKNGYPDTRKRGESDLNGDGFPDRIS
jgi:hypothetical protein